MNYVASLRMASLFDRRWREMTDRDVGRRTDADSGGGGDTTVTLSGGHFVVVVVVADHSSFPE